MAFLLGHAARGSLINPLKTCYKFSKHYSVLCSHKMNSSSDNFLNKKIPLSNQTVPCRNFSVEGFVQGYFNMYISVANSIPATFFIDQLVNIHDCGIPWWATIFVACASLRSALIFPLTAVQDKEVTEMFNAGVKMKSNMRHVEQEVISLAKKNKWTQLQTIEEIKKQHKKTKKNMVGESRLNLKLYRVVVTILAQVSLWLFFTICIRMLTVTATDGRTLSGQVLKHEFSNEGILWFKNLLNPDRYGIPALMGITNLALIEFFDLKRGIKTKFLTYVMRGLVLVLCYISSVLPATISFFWLSSATVAIGQHLLLLSPRFRKFARLPPSPVDPKHPYRVMRERFRVKWGF